MALSFDSVLKETLTIGHGLALAAGAYGHKLYSDLKAKFQALEAKAKTVVADVKKDL